MQPPGPGSIPRPRALQRYARATKLPRRVDSISETCLSASQSVFCSASREVANDAVRRRLVFDTWSTSRERRTAKRHPCETRNVCIPHRAHYRARQEPCFANGYTPKRQDAFAMKKGQARRARRRRLHSSRSSFSFRGHHATTKRLDPRGVTFLCFASCHLMKTATAKLVSLAARARCRKRVQVRGQEETSDAGSQGPPA